jgi:hypothetical protein
MHGQATERGLTAYFLSPWLILQGKLKNKSQESAERTKMAFGNLPHSQTGYKKALKISLRFSQLSSKRSLAHVRRLQFKDENDFSEVSTPLNISKRPYVEFC